jgi:hypothetical protein
MSNLFLGDEDFDEGLGETREQRGARLRREAQQKAHRKPPPPRKLSPARRAPSPTRQTALRLPGLPRGITSITTPQIAPTYDPNYVAAAMITRTDVGDAPPASAADPQQRGRSRSDSLFNTINQGVASFFGGSTRTAQGAQQRGGSTNANAGDGQGVDSSIFLILGVVVIAVVVMSKK